MEITVECQTRAAGSNPRALRREGLIPAALYGHQGTESISLTLKEKEAQNLLKKASVNNTLIDLKIPELSWNGKALIREVQSHPWKRTLYHLSFFATKGHGPVEVVVQINVVGNAVGVKNGGIVDQMLSELAIQCDPSNIPEFIEINVSDMDIGTTLRVNELVLPAGVTAMDDPDRNVVSIVVSGKMDSVTTEV
ncbi:MAG: 50S ribosomal protein L25/general stress protein Ctc [Gomphosphaeria aponina SAG 52.96 = DSM 107014]|uniref:Large ribosomal subunit protein bL25 n=1 Tax=Gomphosphaeria aponina SAG 52.96 = DSM 107014 TaxID=1521640 RepID=A0A941GPG1_9CHRO|nr:50S ribosomal protein L25/general stress protein Ctc [Gomphosphaeria aponina SAG 52.96 = DSM 107014]